MTILYEVTNAQRPTLNATGQATVRVTYDWSDYYRPNGDPEPLFAGIVQSGCLQRLPICDINQWIWEGFTYLQDPKRLTRPGILEANWFAEKITSIPPLEVSVWQGNNQNPTTTQAGRWICRVSYRILHRYPDYGSEVANWLAIVEAKAREILPNEFVWSLRTQIDNQNFIPHFYLVTFDSPAVLPPMTAQLLWSLQPTLLEDGSARVVVRYRDEHRYQNGQQVSNWLQLVEYVARTVLPQVTGGGVWSLVDSIEQPNNRYEVTFSTPKLPPPEDPPPGIAAFLNRFDPPTETIDGRAEVLVDYLWTDKFDSFGQLRPGFTVNMNAAAPTVLPIGFDWTLVSVFNTREATLGTKGTWTYVYSTPKTGTGDGGGGDGGGDGGGGGDDGFDLPDDTGLFPTDGNDPPGAIQCIERFDSRQISNSRDPSATLIYNLWRSENELDIALKLEATAPPIYEGLEADNYTLDHQGGGVWLANVLYKIRNQSSETFDTTGGSVHVTQSRGTQRYGIFPPDFQGAIGVSDDRIEGVDITIPAYKFAYTHYVPRIFVSQSYKNRLFQLTGKVNSASFKGFSTGEVLFLGSTGSRRGREDFEITFNFAASPNVTMLQIAPGIIVNSKYGWDYLWVFYHDAIDDSAHQIVRRPRAAYVERVYEFADLNQLGLGA
jgi:hypothetical protein